MELCKRRRARFATMVIAMTTIIALETAGRSLGSVVMVWFKGMKGVTIAMS